MSNSKKEERFSKEFVVNILALVIMLIVMIFNIPVAVSAMFIYCIIYYFLTGPMKEWVGLAHGFVNNKSLDNAVKTAKEETAKHVDNLIAPVSK